MANQSPDRREILQLLARVAAVSQFAGFSRWIFAAEHAHDHVAQNATGTKTERYEPRFFTPAEYKIIDQVTELIIPNDGSPGARDAGVSEFIDFMVSCDDDIQYAFRTGVAWLNAFASEIYDDGFTILSSERQRALLAKLAYRDQQSPTEVQGQEFFKLIREYTVMGFYTSRIGMEQLDYPGLKLYSASPECPHKDDPEHRHLPAPRY